MTPIRQRPYRPESLVRPQDPYTVLGEFGVGFDSSMTDIHKACLAAQGRGRLGPEQSRAWTAMRSIERRLAADLAFMGAFDEPSPSCLAPQVAARILSLLGTEESPSVELPRMFDCVTDSEES
jgi:hypothetical protein